MDEAFGPAALAIITGDLKSLADLLAADPGLAARRSSVSHPTLLQLIACEETNITNPVGSARLLVEAGAETFGPLVAAAGCNSRAVVEFLLDAAGSGDDGGGGGFEAGRGFVADGVLNRTDCWTPLDEAVYWSNTDIIVYLRQRGARVQSLRVAAGIGENKLVEGFFVSGGGLLTDGAGPVRSPFPETVPDALATDPASILDNAFVMAVNNGHESTARLLYDKGARVNAMPPGFHWRGTALHAAASIGDRAMVEWLLSIGADPKIRDGMVNSDAAGWANHHGHTELAALIEVRTQHE